MPDTFNMVSFICGTTAEWNLMRDEDKDNNTLYFITNVVEDSINQTQALFGQLYKGKYLIGDVLGSNASHKHLQSQISTNALNINNINTNLSNDYYTKEQTNYIIDSIIGAKVHIFETLPTPSAEYLGSIAYVGAQGSSDYKVYLCEKLQNNTYQWTYVGTASISLQDYVDKNELDNELAKYETKWKIIPINENNPQSDYGDGLYLDVEYLTTQLGNKEVRCQYISGIKGLYILLPDTVPSADFNLSQLVVFDTGELPTNTKFLNLPEDSVISFRGDTDFEFKSNKHYQLLITFDGTYYVLQVLEMEK